MRVDPPAFERRAIDRHRASLPSASSAPDLRTRHARGQARRDAPCGERLDAVLVDPKRRVELGQPLMSLHRTARTSLRRDRRHRLSSFGSAAQCASSQGSVGGGGRCAVPRTVAARPFLRRAEAAAVLPRRSWDCGRWNSRRHHVAGGRRRSSGHELRHERWEPLVGKRERDQRSDAPAYRQPSRSAGDGARPQHRRPERGQSRAPRRR